MNDVETRQRKLVEKHQKAIKQEEGGAGAEADQEAVDSEKPAMATPKIAEPKAPVQPAEPIAPKVNPAPVPEQSAQSNAVRATLEKIKNKQ